MKLGKAKFLLYLLAFYVFLVGVVHGLKKGFKSFLGSLVRLRRDTTARAHAGGQAIMMLILIFIAGVIGLALTPQFVSFSIEASWAYNGTAWEALAGVFYVFVISILYAVIMIMMLVGASVGAYRVGRQMV